VSANGDPYTARKIRATFRLRHINKVPYEREVGYSNFRYYMA